MQFRVLFQFEAEKILHDGPSMADRQSYLALLQFLKNCPNRFSHALLDIIDPIPIIEDIKVFMGGLVGPAVGVQVFLLALHAAKIPFLQALKALVIGSA